MPDKKYGNFEPIAVIGVGAIFPGAYNAEQFWRNIVEGKDLITTVPPTHWLIEDYYDPDPKAVDKTYCNRGAFIPDVEFDPVEFGIPPANIPAIDTSQLLALVVAKQVLEEVTGATSYSVDLSRVSVILGSAPLEALQYISGRMQRPAWTKALREAGLAESLVQTICDRIAGSFTGWQENTFPGLLSNVIAGRIANRFNLGGTNCTTDAACASSMAALSMAVSELHLHTADMVITGGIDTLNDIIMYTCFAKTQALSLSGDCRPFSDQADGTVLGEGLGMIALKRLGDAEKNQDKIYAVIRGIGTSSDGRSKSIYAPSAIGQSKAILRAYQAAGFEPHTIGLIEAHGTGTRAGDAAEFGGLRLAFSESSHTELSYCALGSIKSQIGHAKSAAGVAGIFKAIMALHHKILPPTLKVNQPNPEFDLANSPFYLNTELRPWIKNNNYPRRAGVSSFGFGGSNFHIALEEYTGNSKAPRLRTFPTELIVLSADTPDALLKIAAEYLTYADETLNYLADFSQRIYDPAKLARLAIIADSPEDLQKKLQQAITAIQQNAERPFLLAKDIYYGYAINPGRVAFLFPGSGSQYIKMGADIAMAFPNAMASWDDDGKSLADIVFPVPVFRDALRQQQKEKLDATINTQSALAVTSLMYLTLLNNLQIRADNVAGYGFGGLVALYAKGELDKTTLLRMAQKPQELTQCPKQFQKIITKLYQQGVRTYIEVGPDKILSGLVQQCLTGKNYSAISLDEKSVHGVTALWNSLGKLFVLGFNPAFSKLSQDYQPTKKSAKKHNAHCIKLNGTNYGKPYPPISGRDALPKPNPETIPTPIINRGKTMSQLNNTQVISIQQDLQRQLIDVHQTYQKMMAETHMAFLNSINQLANGSGTAPLQYVPAAPRPVVIQQPIVTAVVKPVPVAVEISPLPLWERACPVLDTGSAPQATGEGSSASTNTPHPVAAQPPSPTRGEGKASAHNLQDSLLKIIAEKTGYPTEMLNMDMAIEADLGIDSIKRVEIFSALNEKFSSLPEVNSSQMADIQTVGDILSYVEKHQAVPA